MFFCYIMIMIFVQQTFEVYIDACIYAAWPDSQSPSPADIIIIIKNSSLPILRSRSCAPFSRSLACSQVFVCRMDLHHYYKQFSKKK